MEKSSPELSPKLDLPCNGDSVLTEAGCHYNLLHKHSMNVDKTGRKKQNKHCVVPPLEVPVTSLRH
jgi:hypothetical protein